MDAIIISVILAVVITVIISIKEKDNILDNLKGLFGESWKIIKTIVPILVVVVILLVGCFGTK